MNFLLFYYKKNWFQTPCLALKINIIITFKNPTAVPILMNEVPKCFCFCDLSREINCEVCQNLLKCLYIIFLALLPLVFFQEDFF